MCNFKLIATKQMNDKGVHRAAPGKVSWSAKQSGRRGLNKLRWCL